jgi:hypothetical protein
MNVTNSIATWHPDETRAGQPAASPAVFVDGVWRPELAVTSVTAAAPLGVRRAEVKSTSDEGADDLVGRPATVILPMRFDGGDGAWLPLVHGRLAHADRSVGAARSARAWTVIDQLEDRLAAWVDHAALREAATVGDLLDAVAALAGMTRPRRPVGDIEALAVVSADRRPGTLTAVLTRLCDRYRLVVERALEWADGEVIERSGMRPLDRGPRVTLPRPDIRECTVNIAAPRPLKLIAQAGAQVVESTFELVRGWSVEHEGEGADAYGRSTSSDFDATLNVYRLWVLNEDGAFAGKAFDLAGLFDEDRAIPPRPLRFGPALTRDEAGRSRGVVIECSTDDGATWSHYGGSSRVLGDRAGVYLDDDVLPTDFLNAAMTGQAKVRVTATLRCPLPLEVVRWRGNPFAGPFETRAVDFGDAHAWRRVAETSRYHAAVRSGAMTADEADDRARLRTAVARMPTIFRRRRGRVSITAAGLVPALRIGDRITSVGDFEASVEKITRHVDRDRAEIVAGAWD